MFIVLGLVAGFLFFHYIHAKYEETQEVSTQVYAAEFGKRLVALIHAVQDERGSVAAYLVDTPLSFSRSTLRSQQQRTDNALRAFTSFLHTDTDAGHRLSRRMSAYSQPRIRRLTRQIDRLKSVRRSVEDHSMDFDTMVDYYRGLVQEMNDLYYGLLWSTQSRYAYLMDVYQIEKIKEYAELERVYVDKQLFAHHYFLKDVARIRHWIELQKGALKTFLANLSPEAKQQYVQTVQKETQRNIEALRERFFRYALAEQDAPKWSEASRKWTEAFGKLSLKAADDYLERMRWAERKAHSSLLGVSTLGLIAVIVFGVLLVLLRRLLAYAEKTLDDLRIASYAFDSYEAMVIMDPNGTILRVNRAFSDITGYTAKEVVGQTPAMLHSDIYSTTFYRRMWEQLKREGHWRGEIRNRRKNGEIYDERLSITAIKDAKGKTQYYISHFLDISDLKKAEAKARHQATHDFLTGLPNRKLMMEFLQDEDIRTRRRETYNAFLFIDLDDFKKINDIHGHNMGDRVLTEVANRLTEQVGGNDFVARISGDEFCVILTDVGREDDEAYRRTREACEQLLEALDRPYQLGQLRVSLGVSIGIKLFPDRDHRLEIEDLISSADAAMYRAKEEGKNRFVFYDHDVKWRVRELALMEKELQRALDWEELVFYFQPKVGVATGEIMGAELLVRWEHPNGNVLQTPVFLEALNNLAMMPRLNGMAMNAACRFLKNHRESFHGTLAINVSVRELRSEGFYRMVKTTLEKYDVDPSQIEIEILENDLIDDFDAVVQSMERLRALGIQFAIDDFGVGYSSISYLHALPVDTLKVDRSFIVKLHDQQTRDLVRIMISLARVFGIRTVLEGIDEAYQLEFARTYGADIYQGFLFSPAVDERTFASMLEKNIFTYIEKAG